MTAANITIVEYEPKYADSIAEMWNQSNESWGGGNVIRTGQDVQRDEAQNKHLHVFLALVGEEVVGYCSFNYYQEDEGALYIALLNVRPDFHGRKVGKSLVLRAVQATIELGWPRVDLYTWPGNTKAVPTYKKCGFFWEKRDETTHLMNFIPTVLQTEAVRDYFDTADWYADGKRDLTVQPDGEHINGFDYFTYHWVHDGQLLKIDFERTGRGIRLIETNDYLIKADIPQHKLPYGTSYPITYTIHNKSGKPLQVSLEGISNKNIQFDLNETIEVQDKTVIEGHFLVQPIQQEINKWRTHPIVETAVLINGLQASFKTGVYPVFPIKLAMGSEHSEFYLGQQANFYLTLENHYDEEVVTTFTLPVNDLIAFDDQVYTLTIPAKGRYSLPVQGLVTQYGLYTEALQLTVQLEHEQARVESELTALVHGRSGVFSGENSHQWVIGNGNRLASLNRYQNEISIIDVRRNHVVASLPLAKLGPPFSNKYDQKPPLEVSFNVMSDSIVLEAHYALEGYDNVQLIAYVSLYNNGLATLYYRIHNLSQQAIPEMLELKEKFYFGIENSILPYNHQFLDLRQPPYAKTRNYYKAEHFTENWMFTYTDTGSYGMSWPEQCSLEQEGYQHATHQKIGSLQAGSYADSVPYIFSVGTFSEWDEFRDYVRKTQAPPSPPLSKPMEYILNDGNPFISDTLQIKLREHKKTSLTGAVRISSKLGSIATDTYPVQLENNPSEVQFSTPHGSIAYACDSTSDGDTGMTMDIVETTLDFDTFLLQKQSVVFPIGTDEVVQQEIIEQEKPVLTVNNGSLSISASSDYAPSLFSLCYKEQEWLDASFPKAQPKAWWNPWLGGISTHPSNISLLSLMEEKRWAEFAKLHDNKGNVWSGIKMTISIEKNEIYKGLIYHQYFLLLPGVPVLATVVEVDQQTNTSYHPLSMSTWSFFKTAEELTHSRVSYQNEQGDKIQFKVGTADIEFTFDDVIHYHSTERGQKLTLVSNPNKGNCYSYIDNQVISSITIQTHQAKHGAHFLTNPQFYVLNELEASKAAYADLLNLTFTLS
ncbi:GNAT family N-acetyltransferase [Paenibacillus turicensis]|uniref:GNAT family N-acetyltransferase n=1 Tax=Paenibacillus turicensis TaxID=160487 RepID=UPI003D28C602